jgi:hypothetical protein
LYRQSEGRGVNILQTCMNSTVSFKMALGSKGLAALQADEGPLPGVLADVDAQIVFLDKTLQQTRARDGTGNC